MFFLLITFLTGFFAMTNMLAARCVSTYEERDPITDVAFSHDGRFGVSVSMTGRSIRIWRLFSDAWKWPTEVKLNMSPRELAVLPGDLRILVGGQPLRLWDPSCSGDGVQEFQGHEGPVYAVAASPDGQRVLSGGFDQTMRLWDIATSQCLRTFCCNDKVKAVAFSPDGTLGLSGSERSLESSAEMRLWDLESGECLRTFELPGDPSCLAFDANAEYAYSGSGSKVNYWNLTTGECAREFECAAGTCRDQCGWRISDRLRTQRSSTVASRIRASSVLNQA